MTTEITLDHIGGRGPAIAAMLDASHVDADGASRPDDAAVRAQARAAV